MKQLSLLIEQFNNMLIMENLNTSQYEPKRIDRFLVEFPERFNIELWAVQKINKPNFTNGMWEDIKIDY